MSKLLKFWHRVYDDILVWAATLGGVLGSLAWPVVLDMTLRGTVPTFHAVDLIRVLGASIISIVLAVQADKQGTPEQKNTPTAIRRRMGAAFGRGFGWQTAIAALTAAAQGGG